MKSAFSLKNISIELEGWFQPEPRKIWACIIQAEIGAGVSEGASGKSLEKSFGVVKLNCRGVHGSRKEIN